jgi:hypothetical protein
MCFRALVITDPSGSARVFALDCRILATTLFCVIVASSNVGFGEPVFDETVCRF